MPLQNSLDGSTAYVVREIVEGPSDPGIAPPWIFPGHPDDQPFNLGGCPRSSWATAKASIVFPSYQVSMPAKQCVGRDNRIDREQALPAHGLCRKGEPSPLRIGKPKSFGSELLTEDTILGLEIIDGFLLVSVYPAGERRDHHITLVSPHGWRA